MRRDYRAYYIRPGDRVMAGACPVVVTSVRPSAKHDAKVEITVEDAGGARRTFEVLSDAEIPVYS